MRMPEPPEESSVPPTFRLCYITDRQSLGAEPLLSRIQQAVLAGVDLVQIREKDLATRELLELVKAAVDSAGGQSTGGTWVVVNDRLDVALAAAAHGVHLGTHSIPAQIVRAHVRGDFLVGVSCHSLEEALAAQAAGADYLLLGPVYETPSKRPFGPPIGLAKLRAVTSQVSLPVLALGGITLERVRPCLAHGAAGIAGIRIFQDCESLETCVRELRAQFPS
jgi:thiamine-phosphate pyrophosphorylase